MNYTELVPKPEKDSINSGLTPLTNADLKSHFGLPRDTFSDKCQPVTNKRLASLITTMDVGPFNATGLKVALKDLVMIFKEVKEDHPDLYKLLGSSGMLCVRYVRGSDSVLSDHSYGIAIDININGKLDVRGDDKVQKGLLILYSYFHKYGWYWGASYPTEDGMHFGMSKERFHKLMS